VQPSSKGAAGASEGAAPGDAAALTTISSTVAVTAPPPIAVNNGSSVSAPPVQLSSLGAAPGDAAALTKISSTVAVTAPPPIAVNNGSSVSAPPVQLSSEGAASDYVLTRISSKVVAAQLPIDDDLLNDIAALSKRETQLAMLSVIFAGNTISSAPLKGRFACFRSRDRQYECSASVRCALPSVLLS
jgi:hypothetical protein